MILIIIMVVIFCICTTMFEYIIVILDIESTKIIKVALFRLRVMVPDAHHNSTINSDLNLGLKGLPSW